MEANSQTQSSGKYWLLFIVNLAAMIALLILLPEWFWVMLPSTGTFLVKALDWM